MGMTRAKGDFPHDFSGISPLSSFCYNSRLQYAQWCAILGATQSSNQPGGQHVQENDCDDSAFSKHFSVG